ncbi:MAG: sigma-54 dependent transcriptional regulator [Acidobacteriota bacterium]|nr:sigma-54 dependent transcriptional regulator [Acidobacteriota bacterium]
MAKAKILVVDDDPYTLEFLQFALEGEGYEIATASLGGEAIQMAERERYDSMLVDLRLPDIDGLEVLRRFKEITPDSEVIVISGQSSMDAAIEATKLGAFYFINKPVALDTLSPLIARALQLSGSTKEVQQLRKKLTARSTYEEIVGSSRAMQDLYEIIDSVAPSDASVLIIGESGTGKELIANAIHYNSLRTKKPFIKVNCAALPKELIESELFGHTKGAFTGATSEKAGLIAQSDGGSLLLDEIAEMPLELQPKLLRVLQEKVYTKVGSEKPQKVDFRLIAATNRDPAEAIEKGMLREDLYYRINTITIRVPPLRERADDIIHLAEHFLKVFAEKYQRPVKKLSQEAYARLFGHPWRGNVRELQNAIERAVLLCKGETIQASDLPFEHQFINANQIAAATAAASGADISTPAMPTNLPHFDLSEAIANNHFDADFSWEKIGELIIKKAPETPGEMAETDIFEQLEDAVVRAALAKTNGNKQAAANILGIYRPRLYHMMKKHGL